MEHLAEIRHPADEQRLVDLLRAAPQLAQHRGGGHRSGPLVIDFEQAYRCASAQLVASGKNSVGDQRGTPIVSIWPMKEKWKKFGSWFTTIGRDGDAIIENGTVREPMMLQLYYKVLGDGTVLQLAWARPDYRIDDALVIESEHMTVKGR